MGHQIIKKSNGKYAVYSSIIDDFIFNDTTKEEYTEYVIKETKNDTIKRMNEIFRAVDENDARSIYLNSTMTYEQAVARIKAVHNF